MNLKLQIVGYDSPQSLKNYTSELTTFAKLLKVKLKRPELDAFHDTFYVEFLPGMSPYHHAAVLNAFSAYCYIQGNVLSELRVDVE